MSDAKLGRNIVQILTGCLGFFIAVVGYFLADRDAEIRGKIETLNGQVASIRVEIQGLRVGALQLERGGRSRELSITEIRQRLARVEAILERNRQ